MRTSANCTKLLIGSLIIASLVGGWLLAQSSGRQRANRQSATAKAVSDAAARKLKKNRRAAKQVAAEVARQSDALTALDPGSSQAVDSPLAPTLPFATAELLPENELTGKGPEPPDEPEEAIKFYVSKRLPVGETELPVERYLAAKDQMEQMAQYSTAQGGFQPSRAAMKANRESDPDQSKLGQWTSVGPGNVGGRTRAILIHPQTPDVMYAAGVAGGIWKSTNAGQSWSPLTDMLPNIAVTALAFDPASLDIIYAGTGEGFFNSDGVRGLGIFKTTDAGATWKQLANTANSDFYYVNDLAVSRNDSKKVYAATRSGVFRSDDSGETWARVLPTNTQGGCLDLATRTDQTTDYIFAACGTFVQSRIYRNKDAGGAGTWDEVYTEAGMGRVSLAIAPSDQNVVYAIAASIATGNYNNGLHAVFRSTAGGDAGSWAARVRNSDQQKINTAMFSNPLLLFQTDCKFDLGNGFLNQGWYDNVIAVDPLDPNRVWAGGIDLFRSDDGGANWGVASYWWVGPPNVVVSPQQYAHADHHFITFHPNYDGAGNQMMFVGGDGGIFRTDNARATVAAGNTGPCDPANSQVTWTQLNNGYGVTQFYHGSVYPDGKSYFGGTQDNGTVRGTDAGGANAWEPINGGDGGYTAVDPTNPNTLFAAFTGLSMRKSTDDGAHFAVATYGLSDSGLFITPYTMDPSDPQRLYTGGQFLWRTSNGAARWEQVILLSASVARATSLAVAPTDSNFLMVGLSNGGIFRTNRAVALGLSQQAGSPTEISVTPRGGAVSWIAFDPLNRDIAYATYSNFGGSHVWRTTDGGQTWAAIDGSGDSRIPDVPVHCIVVDPSNTARLYVGTDLGVFVSVDAGATWAVENNGFANTVVETLVANVAGGVTTLYAFTHGRGAYKVVANQAGCNFSLKPSTQAVKAAGSDLTVNINVSPSGCNWGARSNVPWITVAPDSSGSTNGTVGMKIEANGTLSRRSGTVAIGGASFTVIQDGQADLSAPTIAITNPPPSPTPFTTPNGLINVAGTASDNLRVASVTWRSDRGLSGTASGTNSWAIIGLQLVAGRNVVTVMASDDAGNRSSATVTIDSTPLANANVLTTVAGTGTRGSGGNGGPAVAANIGAPLRMVFDGAGNLYFCDFSNNQIRRVAPDGVLTTVAGTGISGFAGDGGPAVAARLNAPVSVALDRDGNLYIADRGNQRVRKVTAATGVITTVAGNGTAGFGGDGGPANAAQLNSPNAVAVDANGNLYIADSSNNRIRKVAPGGMTTTVVGTGVAGFSGDGGDAAAAQVRNPFELAVDIAGDLYLIDSGNNRVRKVTISTNVITTIVGTGTTGSGGDGGPAVNASIGTPLGLALDASKNLYLADTGNIRIRRVGADNGIISTIAGAGGTGFSPDGSIALGSRMNNPQSVAVDPTGLVHFGEVNNNRIRKILPVVGGDVTAPAVSITSPTNAATFTAAAGALSLAGTASDGGGVSVVRWSNDRGGSDTALGTNSWTIPVVALQPGDNIITVTAWDSGGNAGSAQLLVKFNPQQSLITVAGTGAAGFVGDGGPGTAAEMFAPTGVAVDGAGNIYFTDSSNHRVRKIAPNGQITAFAGTGQLGNSGDGGPAVAASMNNPTGIAADAAGNVYIADSGNNRARKVGTDGRITTIAGSGRNDFGGDGGQATAAHFSSPSGLALDNAGNLFIVDRFNLRVRKVNLTTGIITTVAGNGLAGFSGDDGAATEATLYVPAGVAVDAAGNIYISDQGNARVRRVNASDGKISTVAGTGANGHNGDGIPANTANLNNQFFIAVDQAGDLYIADQSNHRIRKVTIGTGLISTVAGTGVSGSAGEPSAPIAVQLFGPTGVAVDSAGNLFIADRLNNRIRRTRLSSEIGAFATVSAASFAPAGSLTSESIVASFGMNLATATQSAATLPLPTTLAGTTVSVRDNLGISRLAPLFFAGPDQINYLIPNGTANGIATISVTNSNGILTTGTAVIATVAPGLFAANANGQGVAAAVVFRRKANGQESYEPVSRLDTATNRFVPVPIDLGDPTDLVFLVAYGTGFRNRSSLAGVSATIEGVNAPVFFAGTAPDFIGLDQANLQLDRSLAGKGEVDVIFTVDGRAANTVRVSIK